jgi:hypothetical protein
MTPNHIPWLQLRNSIHYCNLDVQKNLIYFTAANKHDDGDDDVAAAAAAAIINNKPSIPHSLYKLCYGLENRRTIAQFSGDFRAMWPNKPLLLIGNLVFTSVTKQTRSEIEYIFLFSARFRILHNYIPILPCNIIIIIIIIIN